MEQPRLIFVAGCNAAGKSSFIRTRINQLSDFEIIMTDVYKSRAKEVFDDALKERKNIILETVFNDGAFRDWVDEARNKGYYTSLIVLLLDSPQHSIDRVANRVLEQNGLHISGNNVKLNFNESFKNVAQYFFYFDRSDFIYTGVVDENKHIMSFRKSELVVYYKNELQYPQIFADNSFNWQRLNENAHHIIKSNEDYLNPQLNEEELKRENYNRGLGY
jgi:predicted ABC-type ATPase